MLKKLRFNCFQFAWLRKTVTDPDPYSSRPLRSCSLLADPLLQFGSAHISVWIRTHLIIESQLSRIQLLFFKFQIDLIIACCPMLFLIAHLFLISILENSLFLPTHMYCIIIILSQKKKRKKFRLTVEGAFNKKKKKDHQCQQYCLKNIG